MKRSRSIANAPRTGRVSVWVAVFAMVLHVAAASEHLSAAAYAAAGGTGRPLSLLEICTAGGITRSAPDDRQDDRRNRGPAANCPICTVAANAGAADLPQTAEPCRIDLESGSDLAVQPFDFLHLQPAYKRAPARAPPVTPFV